MTKNLYEASYIQDNMVYNPLMTLVLQTNDNTKSGQHNFQIEIDSKVSCLTGVGK